MTPQHILYLAPRLPKLSETFVYRELFALRTAGVRVSAASVHAPERGLGSDALERLADETVSLYGAGIARLLLCILAEALRHPCAAAATLALAVRDALRAGDARGAARLKIVWHGLVGLALARRGRALGVTHLHAHFAHMSASIAMYAARQLGCRFSFTGHAADLFRDRVLLPEKLARAAFVACISHWHRAFYCSLVSRPDEAYPLVRCGVDPSEFAPAPPRAAAAPLRIVAVGRLVPKKGFDLLVDALGKLRAQCVPFTCKLLGDGPEREALAARVAALGLQAEVELVGAAQNAAVRAALAEADLFVLPCRQESDGDRDGIPVALMEAMACAVCAVSGDLPAIRELIENGKTGYLTPPGDASALAGLLGRLARQSEERSRVAQAGRAHIEREFSLAPNSLRLQQSFAKLNRD